ncbi:MAG: hypothetical protein LQ340_004110, partial [Diploschistes diacapsis]
MEVQQGRTSRSPSVGLPQGQSASHSSPPPHFSQQSPTMNPNASASFNPAIFTTGMQSDTNNHFSFADHSGFMNHASAASAFPQQTLPSTNFSSPNEAFKRNSISDQRPSALDLQNSNHQFTDDFNNPFPCARDGSFVLDPALQAAGQSNQSINPADIMGGQEQGPNGRDMLHMDQQGLSPKNSPALREGLYSPNHSHHRSTLDPATAGLTQTARGGEWTGMAGGPFGHRRAPSEHSDVSSVGPSPYLKQDGFDAFDHQHSPLLNAQQDPNTFQNTLGMERFTISETNQQGISPSMSPYPSPRMSPHRPVGLAPESQFILGSNDPTFGASPGPEMYAGQEIGGDMGQAQQMEPPSINVTFAPTRHMMDPNRDEGNADALSPPSR